MIRRLMPSVALALVLAACGDRETQDQDPAQSRGGARAEMAMGLSRTGIESAVFRPAPPAPPAAQPDQTPPTQTPPAPTPPDAALIRAQILLDRAAFSPGVIDGLGGDNSRQAIAAFEKASDLPQDGVLDAAVFQRLTTTDSRPVLMDYAITAQDLAGPFVGTVPTDLEALSRLDQVGYATIEEALAERFHTTEALLRALNPNADFRRAGQRLVVPAVIAAKLTAKVARITVDKTERSLRAYDASGKLIGFYPATIGSSDRPAPSGTVTVVGVAPRPNYTYDPDRVTYGSGEKRLVIAPGPNNPVGSVWIDLSRDTYGIQGTPDPSKIAKTQSNGCVRLTNWSAEELAAAVKPGVQVVFT